MDFGQASPAFENQLAAGCYGQIVEQQRAEIVLLDEPRGESGFRRREAYGFPK
jgi:hypothetical protein